MDNSMDNLSFVFTKLDIFKYCYVTATILHQLFVYTYLNGYTVIHPFGQPRTYQLLKTNTIPAQ